MAHHERLASFILRAGLAVAFLYAATSSFLDPFAWVGFFPAFVRQIVPGEALLAGYSAFQIALALWLLSGRYVRNAAIVAVITLVLIVLSNILLLDILFRDLSIVAAAGALLSLHWHKK